jgi:hypothetical protein
MSRFLIEREFRDGLNIPLDETGAQLCRNVIDSNAEDGVTWFHSYVTPDRKHTFVFTKRRRPNPKIPAALAPAVRYRSVDACQKFHRRPGRNTRFNLRPKL